MNIINLDGLTMVLKTHALPALMIVGLPLAATEMAGSIVARWIDHRGHLMVVKGCLFLILLIIPLGIAELLASADHARFHLTLDAVSELMNAFLPKAVALGLAYVIIQTIRLWPSNIFSGLFGWILQVLIFYGLIRMWPL